LLAIQRHIALCEMIDRSDPTSGLLKYSSLHAFVTRMFYVATGGVNWRKETWAQIDALLSSMFTVFSEVCKPS
jgi:hypothetical protein